MTGVLRVLWLTAVWVALWSEVTPANVLGGLLVSGAIVVCFDTWRRGEVVVRPLAAARFAAYFLYQLLVSTLVVARTVISPRSRIRTGIVAVPLQGCSDAVVTLIADVITLTPGTLTIEVRRDPLVLYVHALDVRDVEEVQRDVRTLEVLAVKAFGDADAVAGLALDDTTSWRGR